MNTFVEKIEEIKEIKEEIMTIKKQANLFDNFSNDFYLFIVDY